MPTPPFDDRDGLIWLDGELIPWRQANLHVLSHALHYASSVFEGERAYGGEVFRLGDHSARLVRSAVGLGFELPQSAAEIDESCRQVLAANGIIDGYVRPVAWRGSEEMGVAAPTSRIHLAIAAWPWPAYYTPQAQTEGVRLAWARWRRPPPDCAPVAAKAGGHYVIGTMAKHEAMERGYDDGLMLDWRGRVAEATGANIFFVAEGALHTPTPDCFLDGLTRQTVVMLARGRGLEVIERTVMPDELAKFDEVFITGSAAEVTPVREIEGLSYAVGPVSRRLMADYQDLVHSSAIAAA
ncbi:MAG: branched-chain amino acid aminotransferase [Alphaproteobacteria bacterium]|jgi:branched-chain amino acid aminotransferase|nr:branched-chain amino acid aminotransferase [Alphaproteobacteria bacterium]MDP6621589.1 branched-chain amino acid aminotransferase [Alphaproteobacteria bacterium]